MPFAKSWFLCAAVFLAWGCSPRNGVVDFGDGRYAGDFDKEGRRHGAGIYHWNNGDHYEGPFLRGKRHGRGVFIWANGDRYAGDYRNGKRHGRGSYNWTNGASYNGQYEFGKRHGRGTFITAEGSRYDGWWRDDLEDGQGILSQPDGRRVEGRWSRGELRTETAAIVNAPAATPAPPTKPSVDPLTTQEPAVVSPPAAPPKRQPVDWSGTEEESMTYFEPRTRGEVSAIHVKETGEPFEGTITILLANGRKRGQVPVVNGLLHGEEILWGDEGETLERNRYENGKLIEERILPQPDKN